MDIEALVTVDFGSAFTKVAVRTGWNSVGSLVQGLPVAQADPKFCIPSVVARVGSGNGERWAIGIDAANQLPGPNVTIHQNWKARLFSEDLHDRSGSYQELKTVATQFFRRLRDSIVRKKATSDFAALPMRICVPRVESNDESRKLLSDVLRNAGWELPQERPFLYEPVANVIGVLSRGRNRTWNPQYQDFTPHRGRRPLLSRMLDPTLSEAFRTGALNEKRSYYGVLVTDIGAFTTDFGFIRFDTSFWDDEGTDPAIEADSSNLGIRELDDAVLQSLSLDAQETIRQAPTAAWDTCKSLLYSNEEAAIAKRDGGVLTLGKGKEAEAIREAIGAFAERVWEARQRFCEEELSDSVHAEIVTGGGIMIPLLRTTLVEWIREAGGNTVHDLLDESEPHEALRAGASERDFERRRAQNLQLVRGASAIGGGSVFFE